MNNTDRKVLLSVLCFDLVNQPMKSLFITITTFILLTASMPLFALGIPVGTDITLNARADYESNGDADSAEASTTMSVLQVAGCSIETNGSAGDVTAGQTYYIPIKVTNTGNGSDTFTLSIHSANGWPVSLVRDDNVDGVHQSYEDTVITDTGLMVADGYCACFAVVDVPDDVSTGDTLTVDAVSAFDAAKGSAEFQLAVRLPSSLTLDVTPNPAYVEQTVSASGKISPAMQCSIDLTVTPPTGDPSVKHLTTSADGSYSTSFTADSAGQYTVKASFADDGTYAACSKECSLEIDPKITTSISASVTPSDIYANRNITVTGALTPAMQVALNLTYTDPAGYATQVAINTDASGNYTWQHKVDSPGSWTITVAYAGTVSYDSASAVLNLSVGEEVHVITFTESASVSPTTVDSAGSAACSAVAVDSEDHSVLYQWSDGGAGGAFSPNASTQNPNYTAPANASGQNLQITLTCTATCAESSSVHASSSASLTVKIDPTIPPVVQTVTPANAAVDVDLDRNITILFDRPMNTVATQAAITFSPVLSGAAYSWGNDNRLLTISHSDFTRGAAYMGTISTQAKAAGGTALTTEYSWTFTAILNPAPKCTVSAPTGPTNSNPITFTIKFNEAVTGLSADSITVTGGQKGSLDGSGTDYTLPVTPSADGTITCFIPAGAAKGSAGQDSAASNLASVVYDSTPPSVAITSPTTEPAITRIGAVLDIAGIASNDAVGITWSNSDTGDSGQCSGISAWTVEQVPLKVGTNAIVITAADAVGNLNTASITVTRLDIDAAIVNEAWRGMAMVAVPLIPDNNDPKLVVGFDQDQWVSYSPVLGQYNAYPSESTWFDPLEATPGRGFWAIFSTTVSVPSGTVPPQDQPFTIHLYPGWNLVGQPYLSPVEWSLDDITVRDGDGITRALRESMDLLPGYAWGWKQDDSDPSTGEYYLIYDSSEYHNVEGTLAPWRAYWIAANSECDLILPPPATIDSP